MYYCGWDGGGSKTAVVLIDRTGVLLTDAAFGPLNANGTSPERVRETVRNALDFMAAQPGGLTECAGLVVGMAGISNAALQEAMRALLKEEGYQGPLALMGDHEIALEGAIQGPGAILIAGTGSICYGRDAEGTVFRVGGGGYLIDDLGSGYAIGRDILAAVLRAMDGRGPATRLTGLLKDRRQIDSLTALITFTYAPGTGKKEIAALAPLLLEALDAGDECAVQIAEKAAADLAELGITALKRHHLPEAELALTGSIPEHYPLIRERLVQHVREALPHVRCIQPRQSPAAGAARLALTRFS